MLETAACREVTGLLKDMVARRDEQFFAVLCEQTLAARSLEEILLLSSLRRKAEQRGLAPKHRTVRIAVLGGCTLYPLTEIVSHFLSTVSIAGSVRAEFFLGDYDNYVSEITDQSGRLREFQPEVIVLLPSYRFCQC